MNALIETGTASTPYLRGKNITTDCYLEAAYNYNTEKVILTLYALDGSNRVKQEEFDHDEANARWAAATGDEKPLIIYQ